MKCLIFIFDNFVIICDIYLCISFNLLYSEMNEMSYFILDNSVLSVIFIISFNWVDLMFSLNNSSCIKNL